MPATESGFFPDLFPRQWKFLHTILASSSLGCQSEAFHEKAQKSLCCSVKLTQVCTIFKRPSQTWEFHLRCHFSPASLCGMELQSLTKPKICWLIGANFSSASTSNFILLISLVCWSTTLAWDIFSLLGHSSFSIRWHRMKEDLQLSVLSLSVACLKRSRGSAHLQNKMTC